MPPLFLPIYRPNRTPPKLFGMGVDELLFLCAVFVLWFFIGMRLDGRARIRRPLMLKMTATEIVRDVFIAIVGILLFYGGIVATRGFRYSINPVGQLGEGILFILWGVLLVSCLAFQLRKMVGLRVRKPSPN